MNSASYAWGPAPISIPPLGADGRRIAPSKRYASPARREAQARAATLATRLFLLAATTLYLCVELPFAAHLVELLAGRADADAVESVERLGRFVSGAALALAAWGYYLPRWTGAGASPAAIAIRLLVLSAACIALMRVGQRTLVDRIADAAPDAWRRAALQGAVLRDAAAAIPATDGARQALTGALPVMSMLSAEHYKRLSGRDAAARAYAIDGFPLPAAYRDEAVTPALAKIRTAFVDYRDASKRLAAAGEKAYPQAERSWAELQSTIANRRLDVNNPRVRREIVNSLHGRQLIVPYDFHPYDRATFFRTAVDAALGGAERSLRASLKQAFGDGNMPLNLASLDAFAAYPAVQDTLKKSLGLAGTGLIKPSAGASAIADRHHPEARKRFLDRFAETLSGTDPLSRDMSERGRDAVRLAVAAAFGIILSALGAAVHLCKLALYAGSLVSRTAAFAAVAVTAVLALVLPLSQGAPAPMPLPLAWSAAAHGLLSPSGHALAGSPALHAVQALVNALP